MFSLLFLIILHVNIIIFLEKPLENKSKQHKTIKPKKSKCLCHNYSNKSHYDQN